MSRHVVEDDPYVWVYGWDNMLQSFFLQKRDMTRPEDDQLIIMLGADKDSIMYEVEEFVFAAHKQGLFLNSAKRIELFRDKDEGR